MRSRQLPGFLEEAAAELNFEGLELTWGEMRESRSPVAHPGLRPAQDLHTAGGLCPSLGHLPRPRVQDSCLRVKDRMPGPTSG